MSWKAKYLGRDDGCRRDATGALEVATGVAGKLVNRVPKGIALYQKGVVFTSAQQ